MALVKIIENNRFGDLRVEFNRKPFELISMELPFYIIVNRQNSRIILDYIYLNEVKPVNIAETEEVRVSYGIHSGRITKIELKNKLINVNNWRHLIQKARSENTLNSRAILNFSCGIELAKVLESDYLSTANQ